MTRHYFFAITLCAVLGGGMSVPQAGAQSVTAETARANPEGTSAISARTMAFSDVDMVATANPHATNSALRILRDGGSAIDAAIAAQMVLNLVEPQSSGIGGGAFLLNFDAQSSKIRVYDGRETAPAASYSAQFLNLDGSPLKFFDAVDSGLSVGVPGLLRMLELAHQQHGKLAWAALFEPAITLARNGFKISDRLHQSIKRSQKRIVKQPVAAAYFLDASGQPKSVGSVLKNPEFAQTLTEVALNGADVFYKGVNADAVVSAVASHNRRQGLMSVNDLADYRALVRDPLCGRLASLQVCGMPPPSSGALTMLQSLSLFEALGVPTKPPGSVDAVHLMSEAYRLAYADRGQYIADPDFATVPVTGLLDTGYTRLRASRVSPRRSMGKPQAGQPKGAPVAGLDQSHELPGTTHLSIVDAQGNAISMTSSIETAFGSLLMVRGYLLNNQLTDFSFAPFDQAGKVIANRVEPGKRPRSSMAPTIVLDNKGRLEAVLGSPGGSSIIQYVTGTLVGMLYGGLDVQQAINAPHFGAKTSAITTLEKNSSLTGLQAGLEAMGHQVKTRALTSGLHALVFNGVRDDGSPGFFAHGQRRSRWAGGADPRREGVAAGN
ncbi:MAG: gamma-glutamyltransferase [Burkholderiaceae bacterium]